jgi:hypothetical protein
MDLIQLDFPELVIIDTIADGNCFFHAILEAVSAEYKDMSRTGKIVQANEFRSYLARNLELKVNGAIVYDKLSRGNLRDFGKTVPEFSLDAMKAELCSTSHVDNKYNELISNTLNIDLYLIDSKTADIYVTGDDVDILYFNRPSIVILYTPGHYELIAYIQNNEIHTLFPYKHRFIKTLRKRLDILLQKDKK